MSKCFRLTTALLAVWPMLAGGNSKQDESVNWQGIFAQSGMMLGVQHGFRVATEPKTRANLGGAFFPGWYRSLTNLHGWSDGDGFLVNYVGHPLQGSSSAYVWVQNDGANRYLEFSNTRKYWRSRMRATLWSWAYSTQFEIGPLSEATIGKIQSRYPQQGFVDHVATPTVGLAWMVAEDFLDKYVIRKFEDRVENAWARMMVRGWLNPSRSFANMMRWKVPWWRDSRGGIWTYYRGKPFDHPEVAERERGRMEAPVEFDFSAAYFGNPGGVDSVNCIGGVSTAQWNRSRNWSWVAEVGGCKMFGFEGAREVNFSGDILTYGVGRRRTWHNGRWRPYAQMLVGGKRITINEELQDRKAEWIAANPGRAPGYEHHQLWTRFNQANGFGLQAGTGVDYAVSDVFTVKLAAFDYNYAFLPSTEVAAYPHTLRVALGFKLNWGNW